MMPGADEDSNPSGDGSGRLFDALESLTRAFCAARDQGALLWTISEYLFTLRRILKPDADTAPLLRPLEQLAQAFAEQALGARHPLLEPIGRAGSIGSLPSDFVDQIVGVLASEMFHRAGMRRKAADDKSAQLLSSLGVKGKANHGEAGDLKGRTVADWRSNSGQFGEAKLVGDHCATILSVTPQKISEAEALEIATAYARSYLAVRSTMKITG